MVLWRISSVGRIFSGWGSVVIPGTSGLWTIWTSLLQWAVEFEWRSFSFPSSCLSLLLLQFLGICSSIVMPTTSAACRHGSGGFLEVRWPHLVCLHLFMKICTHVGRSRIALAVAVVVWWWFLVVVVFPRHIAVVCAYVLLLSPCWFPPYTFISLMQLEGSPLVATCSFLNVSSRAWPCRMPLHLVLMVVGGVLGMHVTWRGRWPGRTGEAL